MSVTTTQNAAAYSIGRTLADYELTHSEPLPEGAPQTTALNPHPAPPTNGNPPGWEAGYRRVPPHRPINTGLDIQIRSQTSNNMEAFFIGNMFQGIQVVTTVNRLWRATGGRINDTYWRFPVGGEY